MEGIREHFIDVHIAAGTKLRQLRHCRRMEGRSGDGVEQLQHEFLVGGKLRGGREREIQMMAGTQEEKLRQIIVETEKFRGEWRVVGGRKVPSKSGESFHRE